MIYFDEYGKKCLVSVGAPGKYCAIDRNRARATRAPSLARDASCEWQESFCDLMAQTALPIKESFWISQTKI